jgi:hypothetical protein
MSEKHEQDMDELTRVLREAYNPPPPVPRDEMWARVQSAIQAEAGTVTSLDDVRARRSRWGSRRPLAWGAAAAAVLALGVGLGRWTAPSAEPMAAAAGAESDASVLRLAAVEHLGRTEQMLRLVRAEGRSGTVDPAMGGWARMLLSQTRLLLDSQEGQDPAMRELLEDLELVLIQMVAVAEAQNGPGADARSELDLALQGLEQSEVLTRIQAATPRGSVLAGT